MVPTGKQKQALTLDLEKVRNFSKNLLTNTSKCDIIKTLREGKQPERKGSPREQVRLSRQRLSLARSLCCASNKCEPNPAGVKIKGLGRVKPD